MFLNKPIPISLFEFMEEGKFDCIEPGQTKEWILSNFPDPDSQNDMGHNMAIWLYGRIEFHFEGDILFLIYCDNFHGFGAGNGIQLDSWLLAGDGEVSLCAVLEALQQRHVSYSLKYSSKYRNVIVQILKSRVELYFGLKDDISFGDAASSDFTLEAFSLIHPDYVRQD